MHPLLESPNESSEQSVIYVSFHAALVIKIQEAGSKDDIKVPLRVLRDEIGRAFFSGWAQFP